jgi:glycosyltransferase involved in cell wall biosynthesis
LCELRILVVAPLPPWHSGGVERVVGEIAKQLSVGKYATVEVYSGDLTASESRIWNGIRVKTYKTKEWRRYASLALFDAIKKESKNFDVVHAHGSGTLIPLIAELAKGETRFVVSPHYHPQASRLSLSAIKRLYDSLFNAYVLRKANRVICVSDIERKYVRRRFKLPASSLVTIPNGIDIGPITKAKPFDVDYKVILSVGRLEKYKQNQLTVEAVKHLPAHYRFYMIGRGSYQRKLEMIIRKHQLEKRVKILGSCSDDDVYRWLRTCSVMVNLSEIEAFGITVLEALAAGKAVVVNNKLGLAELARKFENAVFPIDSNEIDAVKLATIIEEVASRRIGRVDLNEFQWNRIAQRVLEVYGDARDSRREQSAR